MNRTHHRLALIAWCVLALSVPAVSESNGPPPDSKASSEPLQIRLAAADEKDPASPQFRVEFVNSGKDDLTLYLGIVLGNGKAHFPLGIRLKETGPDGATQELSIPVPPIAGRVDMFLVPLPAGATYSLPLKLSDFRKKGDWKAPELPPGSHRFTAELLGPTEFWGSEKEVRIRYPWKGRAQSNEVTLRL